MKYEMTEEQYQTLLEASKPVPLIGINLGMPRSQQQNANAAWKKLGEEMGFKFMTAQPYGNNPREFTAEPK